MERFKFVHLILEYTDVIHERDDPFGSHGRMHRTGNVESCGRQERRNVERYGALGGVQNEQFAPAVSDKRHLIGELEVGEEWNVPRPFHSAEEQSGSQLAHVLDPVELFRRPAPGIGRSWPVGRFGTQQHRYETVR